MALLVTFVAIDKSNPPEAKRTKTTGEPHPNTTKERRGIAAALFM